MNGHSHTVWNFKGDYAGNVTVKAQWHMHTDACKHQHTDSCYGAAQASTTYTQIAGNSWNDFKGDNPWSYTYTVPEEGGYYKAHRAIGCYDGGTRQARIYLRR